eukprot:1165257-Amphidinium_carterae.1
MEHVAEGGCFGSVQVKSDHEDLFWAQSESLFIGYGADKSGATLIVSRSPSMCGQELPVRKKRDKLF